MPVMPCAPSHRQSRRHPTKDRQPMTLNRGSLVTGSISTRSIAPGAARWPELICAPSKAGPVGEEQASTLSLLPSRISALVPTSTTSDQISDLSGLSTGPRRRHRPRHGRQCRAGYRPRAGWISGPDRGAQVTHGRGQRKRGLTQFERIDAQQQVVHHRVADKHRSTISVLSMPASVAIWSNSAFMPSRTARSSPSRRLGSSST